MKNQNIKNEIAKIYKNFLVAIKKIEVERDKKIMVIIKKIEKKEINKIKNELKK